MGTSGRDASVLGTASARRSLPMPDFSILTQVVDGGGEYTQSSRRASSRAGDPGARGGDPQAAASASGRRSRSVSGRVRKTREPTSPSAKGTPPQSLTSP